MAGKNPAFLALLLAFAARTATSADAVQGEIIEVETRKISIDGQSLRSQSASRIESKRAEAGTRSTRVLLIVTKGCPRCDEELNRLRKPGGDFGAMQKIGWKIGEGPDSHIQIVDRDDVPEVVRKLKPREYPAVACVADGEILRSFKDGCTTPLDSWTFGWLIKGQSERPASSIPEAARVETTGNYRLRGNHWTLEGDPNPSKETVLNHIRGPNHGHASAAYGNLETWSYQELLSLHDDLHEREGGTIGGYAAGPYQPAAANRSLDSFGGNRKVTGR